MLDPPPDRAPAVARWVVPGPSELLALIAFVGALRPIECNDVWLHLANGRYALQQLRLVVDAHVPVAIGPKRILRRRQTDGTGVWHPGRSQRAYRVDQGRMMALRATRLLSLDRQRTIHHQCADKPVVTQLVRRLVQRIDDAVGQAQADEERQQ